MASVEELQALLEEERRKTEQANEQLSTLDDVLDELEELRERNRQLEDQLNAEGRGDDLEREDDARDLQSRLEQLDDELQRALASAKEQKDRARDLDLQNKVLKVEKLKLEEDLQKEQERGETLEESVHTLRQRSEQAAESEGRLGARERNHKKSLIKAHRENEDLRKEVADLQHDRQTLYQALVDKDAQIKELENHLQAAEQERKDTENEVEELKRLLSEKEQEITAAQEEISAVGEIEADIEERVKAKVEKWRGKIRALQEELEGEREKQVALQKKCDSLLLESGLREVEQQLVASEEKNVSLAKELDNTKRLLAQAEDENLKIARDNESLRNDQVKFIDVALEKELAEIERLKQVIEERDRLVTEERTRFRELEEEKASLEEELQDREFTLAEYERGHGLTEAVLKQKKLKGDIKRRDKEIRRLNQALSERISAHEKLFETCTRLKKRAGLDENFQYSDLELEEGMKGQTERLQGLITELEAQNDALETERVRLLEALRKNAQNLGERGMRFYGLTAEQVMLVNQYAENLRDNKVDPPLNDKSLQLKEEIRDLKAQLRDVQRDLAAAELQLESGGAPFVLDSPTAHAHGLASQHLQQQQQQQLHGNQQGLKPPGSPGGERSPLNLGVHMKRFADEQASMIAEIKLELQRTLSSVLATHQQQPMDPRGAAPVLRSPSSPVLHSPSSPKHDPGYAKLMKMLQSKLEEGQTTINREQVESMRNELERQSAMNEQLVKSLQEAESMVARLSQQASPLIGGSWGVQAAGQPGAASADATSQQLVPIGLSEPESSAARAFHDQQIAALRLPPEEWTEQYILLHNRLSLCMDKLLGKEKETSTLEQSLRESQHELEVVSGQIGLLYREHLEARHAWQNETENLKREADEARAERDALRAKARRLDTLCAVLEGEEDAPRNHVKELTRKIAVLEVNEVVLARKYNLIAEEERTSRSEKEILQHEMVQAETALRERVLFLEEWKAGAQAHLESLSRRLDSCVPRDSHEQVVRKLASIKHKYRELLGREAQLRGRTSGAQALRRRVGELDAEVEVLRADLVKARKDLAVAREQAEWVRQQQDRAAEGQPADEAEAGKHRVEDLLAKLARYKGEVVEKDMVLETATKKAEIFERRAKELAAELQNESARADQADLALESARQFSSKVEQEIIDLRDHFQGGANRRERKVLEERIDELEAMCGALSRENRRFRELADIASSQVQAVEMANQGKEQELADLREQIRDLNARTDDDAIIGKIQHELTTTKVSYQLFVRKFEVAKAAMRRNEVELRRLEGQLVEKDRAIRHTREQTRARVIALESALEELGGSGLPEQSSQPHSEFALAGMEKLSETIARLGEDAERSEEALRRSEAARRNLEADLEARRVELESARSLLKDLQDRVFDGGELATDQRRLAQRLLELNEEFKMAKLESMRLSRELQTVQEEKFHLEKLREKDEEHMARLEENIATFESALRRRDDEATLRAASDPTAHDGLGLALVAVRPGGRSSGADKAGTGEVDGVEALQVAQRAPARGAADALEQSALVSELQAQIREADRREDDLQQQLERKGRQVRLLRKQLRAEGIDDAIDEPGGEVQAGGSESEALSEDGSEDGTENQSSGGNQDSSRPRRRKRAARSDTGRGGRQYYEADARKLQAAAQQTIASLKDMVGRKNQVIDDLKRKMDLTRSNFLAEREKDQAEIERLTEKLYEDNKAAIHKLRAAYEDIANGTVPGTLHGAPEADHAVHRELMDRLEEADVMLERKDRKILELEGIIEELRILRQQAEDRAGQSAEISEQLREKVRELVSRPLEQPTEVQGASAQARPEQQALVKQLRNQLVAKDKKLAGLRAAVLALKNEFVRSEEEHENELIRKDREISRLTSVEGDRPKRDLEGQDADAGLDGMRRQLEALKQRVERTRADLEGAKKREERLQAENDDLRQQLDDREAEEETRQSQLDQTAGTTRKLQDKVDELRRENLRLKETLANSAAISTDAAAAAAAAATAAIGTGGLSASRTQGTGRAVTGQKQPDVLERRIKVLEAQNATLRAAVRGEAHASGGPGSGTEGEASGSTDRWDASKRLERKISSLTKKLEERTRELEASRGQADQARKLLEQATRDRSSLQNRIARIGGGAGQGRGPDGAVESHAAVSELRQKLADSQRELDRRDDLVQELRRKAEVEQRTEINRLTRDLEATRAHALELEDEIDALRIRQQRSVTSDSLQMAEDAFAKEDSLRQQLSQARRDLRTLEGDLLERDNTILELRFDLEQAVALNDRASARGRFEGKAPDQVSLVARSPTGSSTTIARRPGERFKRERDLENVVDSMKKVVSKLQAENERLKKSSTGNARYAELQKQVKALRQEKQALETTNDALGRRLQTYTAASAKAARLEDVVKGLKKQLRERSATAEQEARRAELLSEENSRLTEELEQASARLQRNASAVSSSEAELRRRVDEQQAMISALRSGTSAVAESVNEDEVRRLRTENERLLNELNGFDLDFFEEIEDLKYKYQQAQQENRELRRRLGDR